MQCSSQNFYTAERGGGSLGMRLGGGYTKISQNITVCTVVTASGKL